MKDMSTVKPGRLKPVVLLVIGGLALLGLGLLDGPTRPNAVAQSSSPSVILQVVSYPPSRVDHEFMWPRPWFTLYEDGTVIRADLSVGVAGRTERSDYYGMTTGRLPVADALSLVEQIVDESGFFDIDFDDQICDQWVSHDTSWVHVRTQDRAQTVWILDSSQVEAEPCRSMEPGRAKLVEWMRRLDELAIREEQPYRPNSVDVIVYRQPAGPVPTRSTPPPAWSAFPGTDAMPLHDPGGPLIVWPADGALAALAFDAVRTITPESSVNWMRDPRSGRDIRLGVRPLPPDWDAWADAVERDYATQGTPIATQRPRVSPTPGYRLEGPSSWQGTAWLPLLVRGR